MHNIHYYEYMKEHIRRYFATLGLDTDIADIYATLHQRGAQTLSELARNSGVERTKIYRMLDELKATGLVEVETQYKRDILRAAPISNIEVYLSSKEQQLRNARASFSAIEQLLLSGNPSAAGTKVQFYRGPEGLKQMNWNETKATTEILAMLNKNMQIGSKSAFFERWVRKINENGITSRGLINDQFIASQQKWYSKRSNERMQNWQARHVPSQLFAITHGMVIYNNVVAYQDWRGGEIFGIEIHNQMIANTQRSFFEMLWAQATPIDDVTGSRK